MLLTVQEQTGQTPPALEARPRLTLVTSQYMEWYQDVSYDRTSSEAGPNPLSTGAIETYRRVFDIPSRDDFHFYMRSIDNLWLSEARKKLEAKRAK